MTQDCLVLRDDRSDGSTLLTLNRPAQFTALAGPAGRAAGGARRYRRGCRPAPGHHRRCRQRPSVPGHDLMEMRANPPTNLHAEAVQGDGEGLPELQRMPQPSIARIHGVATAAGCQLVASCDLAVAADVARFGTSGINVGLFCTSPGVALSRNVGRKAAMEMLLCRRPDRCPDGAAAGLVNRVVPAENWMTRLPLAGAILNKSPLAVAMGKRAFYEQLEMGIDAAYQLAAETMACNMMTADAAGASMPSARSVPGLEELLISGSVCSGRRHIQVPTLSAIVPSNSCSQRCSTT